MNLRNAFMPVIILIVAVAALSAVIRGYSLIRSQTTSPENLSTIITIPVSSPTPSPSPKPTKIPVPTAKPVPPTPAAPAVTFSIDDNGLPIADSSLALTIKNESNGKEQKVSNTSSVWFISTLDPGKYTFSVSFPTNRYFNPAKSCGGCKDSQDVSGFDTCGYKIDFQRGDIIRIACMLRSTRPLGNPTSSSSINQDTNAPTTNVLYPAQNGSITYKIDGKICAITSAPTDDTSNHNEIETEYKFDDGSWSGYASGQPYLCTDSLSNGPHSISYHSKDKAGNVEAVKAINFTVNIEGN